jgi:hypothetical protein
MQSAIFLFRLVLMNIKPKIHIGHSARQELHIIKSQYGTLRYIRFCKFIKQELCQLDIYSNDPVPNNYCLHIISYRKFALCTSSLKRYLAAFECKEYKPQIECKGYTSIETYI